MENALTGVAGKKFILSYSCGKDSTLCLHKMLEAGAEPMALLVMFNPEAGRSYFHGVDPALLKEYGEALELPLLAVPTGGEEYHLSMEAALRRAKEQGVELVCFGDIDIENNRAWGEERCRNVGLEAVYPLWHHDRQENVREVLDLGYRCLIKTLDRRVLPRQLLGRVFRPAHSAAHGGQSSPAGCPVRPDACRAAAACGPIAGNTGADPCGAAFLFLGWQVCRNSLLPRQPTR